MSKKITDVLVPNIRELEESDAELQESELYELMKRFGWEEEFPALVDEDGVVLVGHRRVRVAKLLGITPVTKTLTLGEGEKADAKRVRLALISNIGGKPMTPKDRERIAKHLYGNKEWTMERIAEALGVGKSTISRDLGDFSHDGKRGGTDSLGRKKGGGRPKGSKSKPKPSPAATAERNGKPDCPKCKGEGMLTGTLEGHPAEPTPEQTAEDRKAGYAAAETEEVCDYCKKPGTLGAVTNGDGRQARLHRECEAPWLAEEKTREEESDPKAIIKACLDQVVPALRVAIASLDAKGRLVLLDELRKTISSHMREVTARDADTDHWAETTH
jgi:hypothetical protein